MCANALSEQTKQRRHCKEPAFGIEKEGSLARFSSVCARVQEGSTLPAWKLGRALADQGLARNSNAPLIRQEGLQIHQLLHFHAGCLLLSCVHPKSPGWHRSISSCRSSGAEPGLAPVSPLESNSGVCVAGETLGTSSLMGVLLCICSRSCFNISLSFCFLPRH